MHRVIKGIKWARALDARPPGIPIGRPRGAKRQGVKYEKDFAKALGPRAWHGKWFEFRDENGSGVCQPDVLMRVGDTMVILECKYTYVREARGQVNLLYVPVVEAAYGLRAVGVTVVKNLVPGMNAKVFPGLEEAVKHAITTGRGGPETVLHWLAGPVFVGAKPGHVEQAGAFALASL